MVRITFSKKFKKTWSKINDQNFKMKIEKQVTKIINHPEIGKPMKFTRKGTRELYISPYRLATAIIKKKI